MLTDYEQGRHDCRSYYQSQAFGAFTKAVRAEDAIKLFLPPVKEMMTQISMPLPKDRKEWINGFKDEQLNLIVGLSPTDD